MSKSLAESRVAVIGGGNMGAAFAGGFCEAGLSAKNLLVVERSPEKRAQLEKTLGCNTSQEISSNLNEYEYLVIAVKPQDFIATASDLSEHIADSTIAISIMAGVSFATMSGALPSLSSFVRCAPNLPSQIQEGVTGYVFNGEFSDQQRSVVSALLESSGYVLEVTDEAGIDAITALCGSGSGYVFYLLDAFERAAKEYGFTSAEAKQLMCGVFSGAVKLYSNTEESAAEMQARVTSKGGTTAAGIGAFQDAGVADALVEGVAAAFKRAQELAAAK